MVSLPARVVHMMLLLLVLPNMGGCAWFGWPTTYSHFAIDVGKDQPWIGANARARAFVSTTQSWAWASTWLEWTDAKGNLVARSDRVIQACNEWISDHPVAGATLSVKEVIVMNPRFIPPREAAPLKTQGFSKVRVIVCVNPVIVVMGPGPIGDHWFEIIPEGNQKEDYDGPAGRLALEVALRPKAEVRVMLDDGYDYGTEVPYEPEVTWFSPDLETGPRAAEYVSDDTRRIAVPWGDLILERSGDRWIVNAQGR